MIVVAMRSGAAVRWACIALATLFLVAAAAAGYRLLWVARAETAIAFLPGRTVAIDPGHGGLDGGAEGRVTGVKEKVLTLAISLRLRDLLRGAGARVVLTRDRDIDLGLAYPGPGNLKRREFLNRAGVINRSGADVAVSIHCNGFPSPVWSGAQTFYDRAGGPDAERLAHLIQREFLRLTPTDREASSRLNHYVLRHAAMPAATVEVGFLTNPTDEKNLTDPAYQQRVAWAIFLGIARYFATSSPPTAPAGPGAPEVPVPACGAAGT